MQITGVIIAGGKSKRMGKDKLTIRFEGQTLLSRAVNLLEKFTDTILLSTNKTDIETKHRIIRDEYAHIGPIAGIYQALLTAKTAKILVIPVDMPLLNTELITYLLQNTKQDASINVFKTKYHTQMLVGIYDKRLLPIIKNQIAHKQYKLRDLLSLSSVNTIEGGKYEHLFINANTPADLQKIKDQYER